MTLSDYLIDRGVGRMDALRIERRLQSGLVRTASQARSIIEDLTDEQMIQDARFGWFTRQGPEGEFTRLLDPEVTGDPPIPNAASVIDLLPRKAFPDWLLQNLWDTMRDNWQGMTGRSLPDLPSPGDPAYRDKLLHILTEHDHPYPGHPTQILKAYLQTEVDGDEND